MALVVRNPRSVSAWMPIWSVPFRSEIVRLEDSIPYHCLQPQCVDVLLDRRRCSCYYVTPSTDVLFFSVVFWSVIVGTTALIDGMHNKLIGIPWTWYPSTGTYANIRWGHCGIHHSFRSGAGLSNYSSSVQLWHKLDYEHFGDWLSKRPNNLGLPTAYNSGPFFVGDLVLLRGSQGAMHSTLNRIAIQENSVLQLTKRKVWTCNTEQLSFFQRSRLESFGHVFRRCNPKLSRGAHCPALR